MKADLKNYTPTNVEYIIEEDAKEFADYVEATYEDCDVEFNYGGQPIYYYVLSVE